MGKREKEKNMKVTTQTLRDSKKEGKKIAMLTAYDFPTAQILDEAGIDIVLVGDSLGNAVLGYENTMPVTMDEMIHHTKAVSRGVKNALLIADMPFMSYQLNPESALYNASRFIKVAGANGVKIEGVAHLDAIKKIIDAGIPVMGHIGLTPQSVNQLGGYLVQGKSDESARSLIDGAKLLEKAGVFSVVLEMMPPDLAARIAGSLSIPAIGCGAGPDCDGQVLVINDLLGLSGKKMPKFAKSYIDMHSLAKKAVEEYISEVRDRKFP